MIKNFVCFIFIFQSDPLLYSDLLMKMIRGFILTGSRGLSTIRTGTGVSGGESMSLMENEAKQGLEEILK